MHSYNSAEGKHLCEVDAMISVMSICQHFVFLETESAIFVETFSSCSFYRNTIFVHFAAAFVATKHFRPRHIPRLTLRSCRSVLMENSGLLKWRPWRPYGRIACQEVYEWQIPEGCLCYVWDRSRLHPQTDRDGGSVRRIDEERIVLLTPDWLKCLNTYVWQTFRFVLDASSSCFFFIFSNTLHVNQTHIWISSHCCYII